MSLKKLSHIADLEHVVETHQDFVIFKNSLTCPISKQAFNAYTGFAEESETPTFYLNVQESNGLSDYISESYRIKHETPQVIYVNNGEMIWHTSHSAITEKSLREHVS